MQERPFTLSESLGIAIQIAGILGEIPCANIIHKHLTPANTVVNRSTNQLKIIDFSIAALSTPLKPSLKNPNILECTLAYI